MSWHLCRIQVLKGQFIKFTQQNPLFLILVTSHAEKNNLRITVLRSPLLKRLFFLGKLICKYFRHGQFWEMYFAVVCSIWTLWTLKMKFPSLMFYQGDCRDLSSSSESLHYLGESVRKITFFCLMSVWRYTLCSFSWVSVYILSYCQQIEQKEQTNCELILQTSVSWLLFFSANELLYMYCHFTRIENIVCKAWSKFWLLSLICGNFF